MASIMPTSLLGAEVVATWISRCGRSASQVSVRCADVTGPERAVFLARASLPGRKAWVAGGKGRRLSPMQCLSRPALSAFSLLLSKTNAEEPFGGKIRDQGFFKGYKVVNTRVRA